MMQNSSGKIWYGMHFYPGVAQYSEPDRVFKVYLNEDTLRKMDPTFAGKPIFVEHVDSVDSNLNKLRTEADGWVIESFYNKADGKHWVKFITVSEEGERAIKSGMRLSNAYIPTGYAQGGMWNGVEYDKEIVNGEFEHLALVRQPRYEESVIMTPEEFKKYNEENEIELKRLANSNEKGEIMGKLNFFKRAKVENTSDLETMSVTLPKSGKEITLSQIINDADEKEMKKNDDQMADMGHKVKMHDGSMCNVGELLEKHKALNDEHEALKKLNDEMEKEIGVKKEEHEVGVEGAKKNDEMEEEKKKNKEDEEMKKKALELAEHEEKEIVEAKKKNEIAKRRERFEKLKNAPHLSTQPEAVVELLEDQVARGHARYGSK